MVKIFTKNNCPNCKKVKRALKFNGVEFVEANVETDEEAFNYVKNELQFSSLPVLEIEGYDPFPYDYSKTLAIIKELNYSKTLVTAKELEQ